ncbi:MAG: hypothetical protein RDU14_15215 [Melioribacteraceae bacterium]|nr:hypothetical protein [Melioribacteraceae bacterium]
MLHNKPKELIQLIPTKHSNVFNVQLNLECQTRFIGKIDSAGQGTFITNRTEKHLFRKLNALGINHFLLSHSSIPFKNIVINYCGKKLYSTREYFLKKGKTFQFSKKGFEVQQFVPIDELNLKTVRYFERSTGFQDDLFQYVA